MANPVTPVIASGTGILIRLGWAPIRGKAELTKGSRGLSFQMLDIDGRTRFSVMFSDIIHTSRDVTEPRNVIFKCPIDPCDELKLCFDSPINAENFYNGLCILQSSQKTPPTSNVTFRKTAGQQKQLRVGASEAEKVVQPRPISEAPHSALIRQLRPRLSMEAPGKLNAPPVPPRRESSLKQNQKVDNSSPHSSSLPSTSTLKPPSDIPSRSHAATFSTPTMRPKTSPALPTPSERRNSMIVDDVPIFYKKDITLIKQLERGSQGVVELVSTKFYRKVAVKYFDRRVREWDNSAKRELYYLLKTTSHPNIIQFRGVVFESPENMANPLGLLMEYMECGSVHTAIYNLSETYLITTPLNWIRQAASALSFLHTKRLVHRDVKPANMLLGDKNQRLKISDFGLCSKIDIGMTADVGTVVYIAPEVVGPSKELSYDEKCDVFSLGITFWEMVHRTRPFEGYGFLALLSSVKDGLRPSFNGEICSLEVQELIEKMWAEKATDRPKMEEVFDQAVNMLENAGFFTIYE